MTQASRPNADHIANYPTSDAGPYSRDQWAEYMSIAYTGDAYTTQGPFVRYLNELEVTNPAGITIRVDTGAGICTGTVLVNSATVDFTPTTPAVGDRIDKVVLCLNNTNATYNTNLEFPIDLTDYNGTASIEPYSCRLAILTGVDGGATRVLVQTANYFMVELARYTITMAPAISVGPTDYREFAYFSSTVGQRQFVAPALVGDNYPYVQIGAAPTAVGVGLSTGFNQSVQGFFVVPADLDDSLVVQAVYLASGGAGDIVIAHAAYYGACAESFAAHNNTLGATTLTAVTTLLNTCIADLSLTSATAGDIVQMTFQRNGADGADTYGSSIWFVGWLITYKAAS